VNNPAPVVGSSVIVARPVAGPASGRRSAAIVNFGRQVAGTNLHRSFSAYDDGLD
jgi:hypothetical protein